MHDRAVAPARQTQTLDHRVVEGFGTSGCVALRGLLARERVEELSHRLAHAARSGAVAADDRDSLGRLATVGLAWRDEWLREFVVSATLAGAAIDLMRVDEALCVLDTYVQTELDGVPTPFHQDYPYLPCDRRGALSLWVALCDEPEGAGGFESLVGSHIEGPLGRFNRAAGDDLRGAHPELADIYPRERVEPLSAGDVLAYDSMLVHGEAVASTTHPRSWYLLTYLSPEALYTGAKHRYLDALGLQPGEAFGDSPFLPRIVRPGVDGMRL